MATLVLTAVGSVFGPVGGAVGALLGQAIDGQIFKPKGREGPRLQDLKVQTSSYGAPIQKLFGTMRVAGTVIWATDLVEHRSRQSGGKGRPSTTTYSYSASFAVLLSARSIESVGRIWADGNLLRGSAGDWKSDTGFRLHNGGEDQQADPFVASAEGAAGTPAYRGCAYVVFENMALAPFGNRIPSLTFEVEADVAPAPVGAVLEELSGRAVRGGGAVDLRGFAAYGDSVRSVAETLGAVLPLIFRDEDDHLQLVSGVEEPVLLRPDEISAVRTEKLASFADLPGALSLGYYDPARDYQAGLQQARRPGGRRNERAELAAAMNSDEARSLAEDALARMTRERGRLSIRCGWKRLTLGPGALVRVPGDQGLWRVVARTIDRTGVGLDLRRASRGSMVPHAAEPGRSLSAPDRIQGPTTVHLLDLPPLTDAAPDVPRLYVAAAGPSPGWRRASLLASLDDGASWSATGSTAAPATLGTALSALPATGEELFDTAHFVDVVLLHPEMLLHDADEGQMLGGANLALVGAELVQFGRAEPLGSSHWRLSRLVRGRRGTGWAANLHAAGERFVLIEPDSLLPYDPPVSAIGATVRIMASGIGDPTPVEARASAIGEALRPPPPVHLEARRRTDGGFDLGWVRSSRTGWAWLDGTDAPLGEDREAYRLSISLSGSVERVYELSSSAFDYAAAAVSDDSSRASAAVISVVQIGTRAVSRPATLIIPL